MALDTNELGFAAIFFKDLKAAQAKLKRMFGREAAEAASSQTTRLPAAVEVEKAAPSGTETAPSLAADKDNGQN